MRKILFLDIDGVLNSYPISAFKPTLHQDKVLLLKQIVEKTKCEIVLSSMWRLWKEYQRHLWWEGFKPNDIPQWIDKTPEFDGQPRSKEINEWVVTNLKEQEFLSAILDDDWKAQIDGGSYKFFKTQSNIGLTQQHVDDIVNYFGAV